MRRELECQRVNRCEAASQVREVSGQRRNDYEAASRSLLANTSPIAAVNSPTPVLGTMMVLRRPCASSVMRRNFPRSFSRNSTWKYLRSIWTWLGLDDVIHLQSGRDFARPTNERKAKFQFKTRGSNRFALRLRINSATSSAGLAFLAFVRHREVHLALEESTRAT